MAEEAVTDETTPTAVEESVPQGHERRKTIESALVDRPAKQKDLIDRDILHGTESAAVQIAQRELEHKMAQDKLKQGLAHRPNREELEERHILLPEGQQPDHHEVEKKKLEGFIGGERPEAEDLVKKGILSESEITK